MKPSKLLLFMVATSLSAIDKVAATEHCFCGPITFGSCEDSSPDCNCSPYNPPGGCDCNKPTVTPPGGSPRQCYCTDWGGNIQYDVKIECMPGSFSFFEDCDYPALDVTEPYVDCEIGTTCGDTPPWPCGLAQPQTGQCAVMWPPQCDWTNASLWCASRILTYGGSCE